MPNDEIYKAVLAVDESKLTEPHIKTMQMCAPDRTEVGLFLWQGVFMRPCKISKMETVILFS